MSAPVAPPPATSDLTLTGAGYLAKLRRSGRSPKLAAAYLLLLHALLRQAYRIDLHPTRPQVVDLSLECRLLGTQIAVHVAERLAVPVPAAPITAALQTAITRAVANAAGDLASLDASTSDRRRMLRNRFALIAVAETQNATAAATRTAAEQHLLPTIVRETTSATPCDRCVELAGVYHAPFITEIWEVHPNCACAWSRGPFGSRGWNSFWTN